MKARLTYGIDTLLHSYSQIFFSQNKVLALCIVAVTMLVPRIGLMGLCAVVAVNALTYLLGFNRLHIREGLLGFNALLMGLWLGFQFEVNGRMLVFASVSLLLLTVVTTALKGYAEKKGVPFLSIPFILTYWIAFPVGKGVLGLVAAPVFVPAEGAPVPLWHTISHCMDAVVMPEFLQVYFRTLAGTFWIDSIAGGILLTLGLLWFSRIAFSLSVLGFGVAWISFQAMGLDMQPLTVFLTGSNYILLTLSIGGFFLVPNGWSYLASAVLTPVLMLLLLFLTRITDALEVRSFTFAFSLLSLTVLYLLQHRTRQRHLLPVLYQYYHPEKTLYKYRSSLHRFKHAHLAKVTLPFFGEWKVSQGHDGKITHLGEWSKALDFVIEDERGKTYADPGAELEDFHCFNKPVLAPLDGWVHEIVSHVDDNEVGGVNTAQNWGNTIVLRHADHLFSQLSHLRKDSLKVAVGDWVTRGSVLASCGNSGRSPEPHLHFQMQSMPQLGAKTLSYPLAYFIEHKGEAEVLHVSAVPREGMMISNVQVNALLRDSLSLTPGRKLRWTQEDGSGLQEWEVFTDAWNRSYLLCHATQSYAYFENDGILFRFTDFEGSKDSLLFDFYLSQYRLLLGCHPTITLTDEVPLIHRGIRWVQWLQDFVAPFFLFTHASYSNSVSSVDDAQSPTRVVLRSQVETQLLGRTLGRLAYETTFAEGGIRKLTFLHSNPQHSWICVG